jgi:hypothetical protein
MERYRAVPFDCLPLGRNCEFVRVMGDDRGVIISSAARKTLAPCMVFETLAHHAGRVLREMRLAEGRAPAVSTVLQSLVVKVCLCARVRSRAPVHPRQIHILE